ncbi:lamin tail domain-containing protein [Candidatus Woesebacteria bacterium]|nr:lamin tail domain-containing protein [Candidatus Woesebacteria bacterium]
MVLSSGHNVVVVKAQTEQHVQMYEVFVCNGAGEKEWLTLKNSSSTTQTLTNWIITDELGSSTNTYYLNTVIPAGKIIYVEIPASRGIYNADTDIVYVKSDGTTVDSFSYGDSGNAVKGCDAMSNSWQRSGSTWIQTDTKLSYVPIAELLPVTLTSDPISGLQASTTPTPTATPTTSPTPTPSPTSAPQPTGISLSEVYACQIDDEHEWIELYNGSDTEIKLVNWELKDKDNHTQPIKELVIPAKSYRIVEIMEFDIGMLTNTGDTIRLLNGAKEKVDEYSYTVSCKKGSSFSKIGTEWKETVTPTKNSANTLTTPTPTPSPTATASASVSPSPSSSPIPTETLTVLETATSSASSEPTQLPGQILGTTQTVVSTTEADVVASQSAKQTIVPAVVAIGSGTVLFSGSMLYLGLDWFTKMHGKLPFPIPFLK